MNNPVVIGVDIGGSHVTSLAVDLSGKKLLHETTSRSSLDSLGPADEILSVWAGTIRTSMELVPSPGPSGIGFAMPGPFDYPDGIARFHGVRKYDALNQVPVREEIRKRLGLASDFPVRFLNDATCFAVGEAWMGEASRFERSVAITLGTGFGSAFLINGIPVETGNTVPESGCVYHLPYRDSTANDYFSSQWFRLEYNKRFHRESPGLKELSEQAGNNPGIMALFREFGASLALFLAPWLRRYEAGCLTIGGNISKSYHLFEEPFINTLRDQGPAIPVFLSCLGECAAIGGAARLLDDDFYSKLPYFSTK